VILVPQEDKISDTSEELMKCWVYESAETKRSFQTTPYMSPVKKSIINESLKSPNPGRSGFSRGKTL